MLIVTLIVLETAVSKQKTSWRLALAAWQTVAGSCTPFDRDAHSWMPKVSWQDLRSIKVQGEGCSAGGSQTSGGQRAGQNHHLWYGRHWLCWVSLFFGTWIVFVVAVVIVAVVAVWWWWWLCVCLISFLWPLRFPLMTVNIVESRQSHAFAACSFAHWGTRKESYCGVFVISGAAF